MTKEFSASVTVSGNMVLRRKEFIGLHCSLPHPSKRARFKISTGRVRLCRGPLTVTSLAGANIEL